jgi:hypothetical protein
MLLLANNTQVFQHLYFSVCCGGAAEGEEEWEH